MTKEEMRRYWAEKEERFNEKLVNRAVAYYEGGHPHYPDRAFGLLFIMSGSLNFENFEKKVLLPVKQPAFKKIEFRIPVNDIDGYRVILPEKPPVRQFWKLLQKDKPPRIEIDYVYYGLIKTVVFSEVVPQKQWDECLAWLMKNKKKRDREE